MLTSQELKSIRGMIDHTDRYEREFMREYAQMELDMIKSQTRDRALNTWENRAFQFAIEILAQLDTREERANPLYTRYKRNELMREYRT